MLGAISASKEACHYTRSVMRAFIAIRIPLQFREALAGEAASLVQISRHTRPVTVGNIHLTLAFLGNVSSQSSDSVMLSLIHI